MRKVRKMQDPQTEFVDVALRLAAASCQERGATVPLILDRMLTFAAAQAALIDGSAQTARQFRQMADRIEAGCFYSITGEGRRN